MTASQDIVKVDEITPLLPRIPDEPVKYGKSVLYRALLCGFMVSLSFGVTQVPLIYVFRLMTCEAYYTTHPSPPIGTADRCDNHQIEAATARAVSLLGASTTLFGVLNLFVTSWTIKKFGIKTALLISVFWPAVRLAVQNIGVELGGSLGIVVIQSSQVITILGGPAGYLLALNSYVTEIIDASERTGSLGKLQGCSFFGTASAFLIGGVVSDVFGIVWPFRLTLGLFLLSCVYVLTCLPWLPLNKDIAVTSTGISKFFGPLKTFMPHKYVQSNGNVKMEYGTILLSIGVFLGVLATGYQSVLLQMFSTDVFHFGTTENGYLISLNVFIRGVFLTTAFPRMITLGRTWFSHRYPTHPTQPRTAPPTPPTLPTSPRDFAAVEVMDEEEEPTTPQPLASPDEDYTFDLAYTRYSLLADGIITGAATFIGSGWQMYAIAVVLPFASGTGSSAKGTILQMCEPGERADALSAITLVEMVARLTTTSVFGLVFAALAEVGRPELVFTCNAAVALVGFVVLLFSRFPPSGSKRFHEEIEPEDAEPAHAEEVRV